MMSGYLKFGLLILASCLLVKDVESWREYSDVDLRIAERQAIPHYIRHGYEYQDIDIKAIMRQRGLIPYSSDGNNNNANARPATLLPKVTQEPWLWRPRNNNRKYVAHSNHIDSTGNDRYEKKYNKQRYNKYASKSKKHRYT